MLKKISIYIALVVVALAFAESAGAQTASTIAKTKTPEQVAQALVDAFNAKDMDGILKTYSPDSVAHHLPSGEVFLKGHAEIKKKFSKMFEGDTKVKVEVVNRIVDGKFVIDKERITGTLKGETFEFFGTVIYEITDGLIRKEWYLQQ
jgi:hypothetical protein